MCMDQERNNNAEAHITPDQLRQRQELHQRLAGSLAVGIYLQTDDGVRISQSSHPGEDYRTLRSTNLVNRQLLGIVMPTGEPDIYVLLSSTDLAGYVIKNHHKEGSTNLRRDLDLDNTQGLTVSKTQSTIFETLYDLMFRRLSVIHDSASEPEKVNHFLHQAFEHAKETQRQRRSNRTQSVLTELDLLKKLFEGDT